VSCLPEAAGNHPGLLHLCSAGILSWWVFGLLGTICAIRPTDEPLQQNRRDPGKGADSHVTGLPTASSSGQPAGSVIPTSRLTAARESRMSDVKSPILNHLSRRPKAPKPLLQPAGADLPSQEKAWRVNACNLGYSEVFSAEKQGISR